MRKRLYQVLEASKKVAMQGIALGFEHLENF
jgi:hypothetical protein